MPVASVLATGAALKSGCVLVTLHSTRTACIAAVLSCPAAMLSRDTSDVITSVPFAPGRNNAVSCPFFRTFLQCVPGEAGFVFPTALGEGEEVKTKASLAKHMTETSENRARFISLFLSTGRAGARKVTDRLDDLGFFTAPASTRFHLARQGGLAEHSLNVCGLALGMRGLLVSRDPSLDIPEDSVVIASLLHDVCKTGLYARSGGRYTVDRSAFPAGHGEKSVILLLRWGLELTEAEMLAIRWHMGPWDFAPGCRESADNYNAALQSTPLVSVVHTADLLASAALEQEKGHGRLTAGRGEGPACPDSLGA